MKEGVIATVPHPEYGTLLTNGRAKGKTSVGESPNSSHHSVYSKHNHDSPNRVKGVWAESHLKLPFPVNAAEVVKVGHQSEIIQLKQALGKWM